MKHESERDLFLRYAHKFGKIAMRRGYVSCAQLKEALAEQNMYHSLNGPCKLIGEIFFENGWMTSTQIESIIKEIIEDKK